MNLEGVPGPRGGWWGTSTILGNREPGTGILNNELYVGRLSGTGCISARIRTPASGTRG
ncbi:hypothetical protein [Paracoccus yeei]|uniref:hypothetical protein n=1 Tax=Paracoccus yeei TaxID=147645 RepID=UPI0037CA2CEE